MMESTIGLEEAATKSFPSITVLYIELQCMSNGMLIDRLNNGIAVLKGKRSFIVSFADLTAALTQAAEGKANSNPDSGVLQGKWERELSAQDTQVGLRRAEKEIKGNKETVTFYGEDNKVLRRHTVDFKLEKKADIHVFTYFNMEVTDGDGKGSRSNDPVSYVYRVVGDELFEVTGLLA